MSTLSGKTALITGASSGIGLATANMLTEKGVRVIGCARRKEALDQAMQALPGESLAATLDVADTQSVNMLLSRLPEDWREIDILINNARFVRPGGVMDRNDVIFARDEMEVNYLGLMRLAQTFGPAMRGRGADGVNSAVAWVNILSVYALSNLPQYGPFSASNAAALSLSQCLRAEMRPGGVRVMNVFAGPTEDAWHQPLPPPKVTPEALARSVVGALRDGLEDVYVGDVAKDLIDRWKSNPKVLERELTE